jgi:surface polysaccharide O-acyltransferase-like enzyme
MPFIPVSRDSVAGPGFIIWKMVTMAGGFGNALFFLIAGYFVGKAGKTTLKRLYKIFLPVLFYSIVFISFALISGFQRSDAIEVLTNPVKLIEQLIYGQSLWFVVGYAFLNLIFTPFVPKILAAKPAILVVICVVLVIFAYFVDFFPLSQNFLAIPFVTQSLVALRYIWVFLVGIILYRFKEFFTTKKIKIVIPLFIITLVAAGFSYLILLDGAYSIIQILFGFAAIGIFICLLNVHFTSKMVNRAGAATFGMYIIHNCGFSPLLPFVSSLPYNELLKTEDLYWLRLLVVVGVFVTCLVVELLRKRLSYLMRVFMNKV